MKFFLRTLVNFGVTPLIFVILVYLNTFIYKPEGDPNPIVLILLGFGVPAVLAGALMAVVSIYCFSQSHRAYRGIECGLGLMLFVWAFLFIVNAKDGERVGLALIGGALVGLFFGLVCTVGFQFANVISWVLSRVSAKHRS